VLSAEMKTVIIGASTSPTRYSFLAAQMLTEYGHEIVPMGIKKGEVQGTPIQDIRSKPEIKEVDTVTLYIGPQRQPEWYDYILSLKPRRIIFNPGTENEEFEKLAEIAGAEVIEGCTLVMLRGRQF
jgi:predicted CoA-binding protein